MGAMHCAMTIEVLSLEFMPIQINSQFYVVYNTLSLCIAIHDFSLRIHVHVLCTVPLLYVYKF